MSEFLKPQSPLQHKDGAFIYPLTTADQVILEDNNRLNFTLEHLVYVDEEHQESAVVSLDADTLNGKTESMLSVANADTIEGYSVNSLIDKNYPVGSVYVSSINSNPSTLFGGEWTIIDKEFEYKAINDAGNYVSLNTTNCSSVTGAIIWYNHNIWVNISFTPLVAITDTTLEIFTFNLNNLGISKFSMGGAFSSMSDPGQVVISYNVNTSGSFTTRDVLIRANDGSSLGTGYTLNVQFDIPISYNDMLDSACNKFYWKRTA